MKKLFIVITLILINPIYSQEGSGDLVLKIKIEKSDFLKAEPLWVKVSLTNTGNENKEVIPIDRGVLKQYLKFFMNNAVGEDIGYGCVVPHFAGEPKIVLKPNETVFDYFDLHEFFGNQDRGRGSLFENSYVFWVELHFNGKVLKSNKISFSIKEPEGDEIITHDLFYKGCNTWYVEKDKLEALEIFKTITTDYPKSVYAELSLDYIAFLYLIVLSDADNTIFTVKELINKYPNSYFIIENFKTYISALKRLNKEYLKKSELLKLLDLSKDIHPDIVKKIKEMADKYN